ncbi:MAG TPA: hypothetical protein VFN61_01405 [Acidimicrobiales bacterium]|nr:hypothetical protein [Acidimicrobiales bacterium]
MDLVECEDASVFLDFATPVEVGLCLWLEVLEDPDVVEGVNVLAGRVACFAPPGARFGDLLGAVVVRKLVAVLCAVVPAT